jgi:glycogen debranching enzyme
MQPRGTNGGSASKTSLIEPYAPRGCVAQAWSVAEVLRCWALTAEPEAGVRDP